MQTVWVLLQMFPNATISDFTVVIDGNGNWEITRWDLTDPQPTNDQVTNYWNANMMNYFQPLKKAELSQKCYQTIISGFSSSALGVAHTYPSDEMAQRNFLHEFTRFNFDPTYTTSKFLTLDAGYLDHTFAQLKQVFIDGHTYGRQQEAKLISLKSQVNLAKTLDDINKITWA